MTEQPPEAAERPLPPRGTIAGYTYTSAYPTPRERTQLVLVIGYTEPAEDGHRAVLGIPLGHADELAHFDPGQLAPAP